MLIVFAVSDRTENCNQLEVFSEDTPRAALWYIYNCGTKWP